MLINEQKRPVNISGEEKTWDRARLITIDNTYNKIPSLKFVDDRITVSPLGEKHVGLPDLRVEFDELETFDLLHTETGKKIGTSKVQDLQVILYSLYVYAKNKPVPEKRSARD